VQPLRYLVYRNSGIRITGPAGFPAGRQPRSTLTTQANFDINGPPPYMTKEAAIKSYRQELWFETKTRRAYLNITPQVEAALKASAIREGLCLVNPMHITASVYINDDEPGLLKDYDDFLERVAPHEPTDRYRHNLTGEDNGDAHIKRQVMGREVVVAVTDGQLDLGTWERIFYAEFDGRRRKRVLIKIIGE
jgi:secondary thiamine-phosphate synthase enzyme